MSIAVVLLHITAATGSNHARSDVMVGKRQHLKKVAGLCMSCDFHGADGGA